MRHRLAWFGAVLVAAAAVARLSLSASQAPASPQDQAPQPTFRTEANYVRVDVYPTRDDAPVTDLQQSDFEVLDNGAPQRIEQFERVVVRAAGSQDSRIEPNTVRESRAMLESARARVFVLFLDLYHVEPDASRVIRKPLVDALDKMIGVDDLVGVMTPKMSAADITFGRKTTTIAGFLSRSWWGERDRLIPEDPRDQEYEQCYGTGAISAEMIKRRHEKLTMDALEELVTYLRGVREERKAVLAITDGWLLYRPNPILAQPRDGDRIPTGPLVGIDPNGASSSSGPTRLEGRQPTATATVSRSRKSTTTSSSIECSTKPIGRTRRSIRSIRAGSPCSTHRSVQVPRRRSRSTQRCSARG